MLFDRSLSYGAFEAEADLHSPAIYELLSFYHALGTQGDLQDGQFIPLTTVLRHPEDAKIFAIGLIPPSASGGFSMPLDRSASVRALEGPYTNIIALNPDVGSSSTGDLPGQSGGLPTSTPVPVGPKHTDSQDFFDQFVAMCNRLGCQPEELAKVIQSESGWREHSDNGIAKGLIQLVKTTACGRRDPKNPGKRVGGLGMSEEEYARFEQSSRTEQLKWIEKFYGRRAKGRNAAQLKCITFGGYNNPDGSLWSSTAMPEPPEYKKYRNAEFQRKAYMLNRAVDGPPVKGKITVEDLARQIAKHPVNPKVLDGIRKAKERLGMRPTSPYRNEMVEEPTPEEWLRKRVNAQEASKTFAQVAGKDLNQSELGKRFMAAQEAAIREMRIAVQQIADTPPLRMLVNPQSLTISCEKLISSGNWGRGGPIVEHWGEQQDKIEGSGKIAAFYSMDVANAAGPGLSRTARQYSASYQNFLSLFLIYKNNGGVWFPDPTLPETAKGNNLSVVGSVYLYYDNTLYIGSFDSLSVNETDESPFTLEFNFSFTVRAWYLFDDSMRGATQVYSVASSLFTDTGGAPLQGGNNSQPSPDVAQPVSNRLT